MDLSLEFEPLSSEGKHSATQVRVVINAELVISTDNISLEDLEEELREVLEKYSLEE